MTRTVHVTWGVSRAESIRDAMGMVGSKERVVGLSHILHLGPIEVLDSDERRAWFATNLVDDDGSAGAEWVSSAPWHIATAPKTLPVYWLCRNDPGELASFLAFASRMVGRDFDVVDVTHITRPGVDGAPRIRSLAQLRPEEIVALDLIALRQHLSRNEVEASAADWDRLRRENAPIRVVVDGQLVSAPLSQFDDLLLMLAATDWETGIALVARTLDHSGPPEPLTDGAFLFARILALGAAGKLAIRGHGPGWRSYQIRLPGM